jgi:hypothetical protein
MRFALPGRRKKGALPFQNRYATPPADDPYQPPPSCSPSNDLYCQEKSLFGGSSVQDGSVQSDYVGTAAPSRAGGNGGLGASNLHDEISTDAGRNN